VIRREVEGLGGGGVKGGRNRYGGREGWVCREGGNGRIEGT